MKLQILSLFSGIGAFEKALENLNIDYELINYCEIDKYASRAYSLIHNVPESMNLGDITKVDEKLLPKDIDMITHGSPCQSFSLAGKQEGGDIGSGTKSSLMWDTVRIVEWCKPKYIIWENVKNLLSKKHRHNFDAYIQKMEDLGYKSYYQVLNAKNYGIPQNRERVYTISIRKDVEDGFVFPKPFELELRLKDMLEHEVDEKYYLSEKMIKYIVADNKKWTGNNNKSLINKSVASTINTGEGSRRCDANNYISEYLPNDFDLKDTNKLIHEGSAILNEDGICSCLTATDYKQPKQILIRNATKKGYLEAEEGDGVDISSRMKYHRGTVQKGMCQTLTTAGGNSVGVVVKGSSYARNFGSKGKIQDTESVCCTLVSAMGTGGGNVPIIVVAADQLKEGDCADISFPNGYNKGNRVFKGYAPAINGTTTASSFIVKTKNGLKIPLYKNTKQLRETIEQNNLYENSPANLDLYNRACYEESQTITEPHHNSQRLWDGLRIRKITPKECFRLMAFEDKDIDILIKNGISNAQLYKMAGNSIVVDVLKYIFINLFINKSNQKPIKQTSIFDFLEL